MGEMPYKKRDIINDSSTGSTNYSSQLSPVSPPYERVEREKEQRVEEQRVETRPEKSRLYTQEEVDNMIERRRDRSDISDRRVDRSDSRSDDNDDDMGVSPRVLKNLQNTVGVFNALKELSSNPIQRAIEGKVGEMASGAIEQAFRGNSGGGKRDFIEVVLNSQLAFGFGQGIGARGPELIDSLKRNLGTERTDRLVDDMLDKYGKAGGRSGGGSSDDRSRDIGNIEGIPGAPGPSASSSGRARDKQGEIDLLLSLDPNNPEHVSYYAESQGGIRVEIARRMLMLHQDELIDQMRLGGLDVSIYEQRRVKQTEQEQKVLEIKKENERMAALKKQIEQQTVLGDVGDIGTGDIDIGGIETPIEEIENSPNLNSPNLTPSSNIVSFKDIKEKKIDKKIDKIDKNIVEIPDRFEDDMSSEEINAIYRANKEIAERDRAKKERDRNPGGQQVEQVIDAKVEQVIDARVEQIVDIPVDIPEKLVDIIPVEETKVETKIEKKENSKNTKMCPKCKKIKVLVETKKGEMCEECQRRLGL